MSGGVGPERGRAEAAEGSLRLAARMAGEYRERLEAAEKALRDVEVELKLGGAAATGTGRTTRSLQIIRAYFAGSAARNRDSENPVLEPSVSTESEPVELKETLDALKRGDHIHRAARTESEPA